MIHHACSQESVYRGLENQLLSCRDPPHRPPPGCESKERQSAGAVATFKWSRDNASVAVAWLDDEDDTLKVSGARDQARGFAERSVGRGGGEQHDLQATPRHAHPE